MELTCLSSGLSNLICEVRETYERFTRYADALYNAAKRFMHETGVLIADLQSSTLPSCVASEKLLSSVVIHVLDSLSRYVQNFTDFKSCLHVSFSEFELTAAGWLKTSSQVNTEIVLCFTSLRNASKTKPSSLAEHLHLARVVRDLRAKVQLATEFLDGVLTESREQSRLIANQTESLCRKFTIDSDVADLRNISEGQMAKKLRDEMTPELDVVQLFERHAISILPAVIPSVPNSHETVNYFTLESTCAKPFQAKTKARVQPQGLRQVGNARQGLPMVEPGKLMTVTRGGYGQLWEIELKEGGKLALDSRALAVLV
jgi:hypothetical protein